jgi:hypothetical protein
MDRQSISDPLNKNSFFREFLSSKRIIHYIDNKIVKIQKPIKSSSIGYSEINKYFKSSKSLGNPKQFHTFSSENNIKEEEILEKKLLEILENHNFKEEDGGYCPLRFCDENSGTPD